MSQTAVQAPDSATAPENRDPVVASPIREFLAGRGSSAFADRWFRGLMVACALSIFAIVGLIATELVLRSELSLKKFGVGFFFHSGWDPVAGNYGAWPFIYGTLVSSLVALVIAVPLAVGLAIFLTEMCPRWLRSPLAFLTELLAAIPSVVYGLWAVFVLVPLLREHVNPVLAKALGWTTLFSGPNYGIGMLAAGVILAIMILPIISSLTREVMSAVPHMQREAVLALGATRWEMIRMGVLRNARIGIVGSIILGLGRALGETMAVTMVIGNRPEIAKSLFAPGYSMASVIANEFSEASDDLYLSALIEIGLALFLVTIVVNALARVLVWAVTRGAPARAV
ncbi:phosphate ABC transporter permease subunit PstC [Acidipila sp. EB88]|uniref:phosphate ABC transporter permease subunit PstC n=1 Tax=Acidipila sp. EB88 TaxID=2305226 RepID=UPI000F5DA1B0|nr:phosphate ABC transporter permease subunit PstC [Acidipila sp. EB88]RRA49243.1 phosphate ABC transporter permease subunit PstC [Acidipila sp. EB88]